MAITICSNAMIDDPEIQRMIEGGIFGEEVDEYYRLGREELDEMGLDSRNH